MLTVAHTFSVNRYEFAVAEHLESYLHDYLFSTHAPGNKQALITEVWLLKIDRLVKQGQLDSAQSCLN